MDIYRRFFTITITVLSFHFPAIAQTNIRLILKGGNQITKVEASDFSFREILSADYNDTLNFNFSKTNNIDLYNIGYYVNEKKHWAQIWLDSGNITIYAHADSASFKIDSIVNSPTYNYVKKFNKEYATFFETKNRDTIQINNFLLNALQENIENPFSLWLGMLYLNVNQNNKPNIYALQEALKKQGAKYAWFRLYPDVTGRINNILSAEHINLSDYKMTSKGNKISSFLLKNTDYYVLDFWFLGCAPCRREHRIIKQKFELLKKNNIEIIGISTDKYSKEWESYLSKNQYHWTNYLQTATNTITGTLSINSFPFYIVINKKGDIIGRYNSFSEILKKFKIGE